MADQSVSAVGDNTAVGAMGSSMHGVTGRETLMMLKADKKKMGSLDSITDAVKFSIPVDSQNMAKRVKILSFEAPHMRSFHLSWMAFFSAFVSTFAAPPLIPVIRDNLDLTRTDIGNASIAAVTGAMFSRICMGTVCDLVGPRFGCAFMLLVTSPAVFMMAAVTDPTSYMITRMFIGFSLATFVSCQYWMSVMFNPKVIGIANGTAAGWGNMGGGATQILMPLVYEFFRKTIGEDEFTAWRLSHFIPGSLHIIFGFLVLRLGQDLPEGQFKEMKESGGKVKDKGHKVWWNAVTNYRTWIFALSYGYCFGVELTIDNIIASYFFDKFHLELHTAGLIAASFGLMNFFSRPIGGVISDFAAHRFGMRGRLWAYWTTQTLGGVLCIALGYSNSLGGAVVCLLVFSFLVQASCGLAFGIVPFVSRRSLGVISGIVGAGGNAGAAITQAVFFTSSKFSDQKGIFYMGCMIICVTSVLVFVHFPQWGSMFLPASSSATEETYYAAEWSADEKSKNMHASSMRFAENAKSEKGRSALKDSTTSSQNNDPV